MGDDGHMRTQASTNLLIRTLLPALAAQDDPRREAVARFLATNHLFFLNVAMAAAKATADWAGAVPGSSIVTGMARNGTAFGIRLAGIDTWFLAPAPPVEKALFHPGYGPADANPDLRLVATSGPWPVRYSGGVEQPEQRRSRVDRGIDDRIEGVRREADGRDLAHAGGRRRPSRIPRPVVRSAWSLLGLRRR